MSRVRPGSFACLPARYLVIDVRFLTLVPPHPWLLLTCLILKATYSNTVSWNEESWGIVKTMKFLCVSLHYFGVSVVSSLDYVCSAMRAAALFLIGKYVALMLVRLPVTKLCTVENSQQITV